VLQATDLELLWVQRVSILSVGAVATVISILVPVVYGLFILAADVVFVIILPQLACAVFLPFTNASGAVAGYALGLLLRVGAGEPTVNLPAFIYYPYYDAEGGAQLFPFRTFAMLSSLLCICGVSVITNALYGSGVVATRLDCLACGVTPGTDVNGAVAMTTPDAYSFHAVSDDTMLPPCEELGSLCTDSDDRDVIVLKATRNEGSKVA
jgi:hypothetical protein